MYFTHVVASLYAWDLLDEGIEAVLDTLQEHTRCNAAYLVALMHHEKRPLTDFYYPHNPKRLVYWTEDSRAYWQPNSTAYSASRIKPRLSDQQELRDTDWLELLTQASRARGMATGAELSHTWIDQERLVESYPDVIQKDIFGRPIEGQPIGPPICPNHPDVRAYGLALYADLVANYDIDMVQTCVVGFHPGTYARAATEIDRLLGVTLGGCFCEHCEAKARQQGIDWNAMVERLKYLARGHNRTNAKQAFELALLRASTTSVAGLLTDTPELYTWLKFRCDSLTEFFAEVHQTCHAIKSDIDVRLNHFIAYPELMGLDIKGLAPHLDSVRSSDYAEQSGDPARLEWKRGYLHSIRRAIGVEKPLHSAISPRPKATPELVKGGILVSAQCGATALNIGHYDGSWMNCLTAIKDGLDEAGITVRPNPRQI